jgi:hypothetical protein
MRIKKMRRRINIANQEPLAQGQRLDFSNVCGYRTLYSSRLSEKILLCHELTHEKSRCAGGIVPHCSILEQQADAWQEK